MGYEIVDDLVHLELKGCLDREEDNTDQAYFIESAVPLQTNTLPFYKGMNPWQTHWQAAKEGQAIIVKDMDGAEIGYAYFKRSFNPEGKHVGTILFQCEAAPNRTDADKIIDIMLNHIFNYFRDEIRRVIPNLPKKQSNLTYNALVRLGFKEIAHQVFMLKNC